MPLELLNCTNTSKAEGHKRFSYDKDDENGRDRKATGFSGQPHSYSSVLCSSRLKQKQKEKVQSECLFFLPAEKAFIDGFGYAALLETWSGFDLAFLSFFLTFLPHPLYHPGAGGELVKSAAIHCVIKIIRVLLALPWEGGIGGG